MDSLHGPWSWVVGSMGRWVERSASWLHQLGCEPVQEFGIRGRAAVAAEVGEAGNDSVREVARPDVIHGDSREERIPEIRQPAGKSRAAASALGREGFHAPWFVSRGRRQLCIGFGFSQRFLCLLDLRL